MKRLLLDLFITFAKIGPFTFGGGYAMISMIEHDCVERKQWITHDEMMNITVIAESTPGPIMVNLATYIGSNQAGFPGAVVATLAVVLPSFLIILLVTALLKNSLNNQYVQAIVITILLVTVLFVYQHFAKKKLSPIALIICSAVLGVFVYGLL